VCELGGQDAKIIIFKKNEETGGKTAITSMNDKCASGTGATIDKCVMKVGLPNEVVVGIGFDDSKLHHVAAKCGVFRRDRHRQPGQERHPGIEIMNLRSPTPSSCRTCRCSRVATRCATRSSCWAGRTPTCRSLRECWRKRIPETWRDRGYAYPKDVPIDQLIIVPENAQ